MHHMKGRNHMEKANHTKDEVDQPIGAPSNEMRGRSNRVVTISEGACRASRGVFTRGHLSQHLSRFRR